LRVVITTSLNWLTSVILLSVRNAVVVAPSLTEPPGDSVFYALIALETCVTERL
jgi:hypothetical protein